MSAHRREFDLTGKTIGSWLVLSYEGTKAGRGSKYLCRCVCGTERLVRGSCLNTGLSKSCGCLGISDASAANAGTGAKAIAKETGISIRTCSRLRLQAIAGGIFKGGKIFCEWMDKSSGGIAFWLDVNVLLGFIQRVPE